MTMLSDLFARTFSAAAGDMSGRDPSSDFWWAPMAAQTQAGVAVSPELAMRLSVVHACVRVLSESVAQLPMAVFRRLDDKGGKDQVRDHWLSGLLRAPNEHQTSFEFRDMGQTSIGLGGNFFAEMIPGRGDAIAALRPMHHATVIVDRLPNGRRRFRERRPNGDEKVMLQDEVFHLPGLQLDPVTFMGLSPVGAAAGANAVGLGLGLQEYGSRFIKNDARPSGIIYKDTHFDTDEAESKFVRNWQRAFGQASGGRFKTAVLYDGMKFEPLGVTNEEAQFLETRQHQDVDIARIYRVPPPLVGILDKANYANAVEFNRAFVVHTLVPWLVRWEQKINAALLMNSDEYFVEFNVAGLLRGDLLKRYQAYAVGRNWGWLSVNEIRQRENMNGIEDGDEYLRPLNMAVAGDPAEPSGMGRDPGAEGQPVPVADMPTLPMQGRLYSVRRVNGAAATTTQDNGGQDA